jgi:hypothetical protein
VRVVEHPVNVRFGSKADMVQCPRHVRFTPKSGHQSDIHVRYVPKADINRRETGASLLSDKCVRASL